jgi:hypothetical protein
MPYVAGAAAAAWWPMGAMRKGVPHTVHNLLSCALRVPAWRGAQGTFFEGEAVDGRLSLRLNLCTAAHARAELLR